MFKLNSIFFILLLCLVTLFLLGQNEDRPGGNVGTPALAPVLPHRIVVVQQDEVEELDPAVATDTGSARVIINAFEGLVRFKTGTALVEPCLARSWETSADGTTWTFHLRDDVVFHDGTPFDAQAVKANIDRLLNRPAGRVATYGDFVFGPVDKVTVVDRYTVKLHLKYPYAPLLSNLAMPMAAPMVSPKAISDGMAQENLPGTGPFMLAGQSNGGFLLKSNPNYWGSGPAAREILFLTVPDPETREHMLLRGQADIALDLGFSNSSALRMNGYPVFRATGLDICYLGFFTEKKPFNRAEVRMAVAMAMNRKSIFDRLWTQEVRMADGPLPPTVPYQNPGLTQLNHDPEEAARLLRQAGCENLSFTLITFAEPRPYSPTGGKELAEAIARELAQAKISVQVKVYPWEDFKQALERREGDAFLYGWISDNGDPDNFLYTLLGKSQIQNGLNQTRYENEQVETLLISARYTTDGEIRRELYNRVQETINNDAPWIIMNHSLHYAATTPGIQGFVLSPTGWHLLSNTCKSN